MAISARTLHQSPDAPEPSAGAPVEEDWPSTAASAIERVVGSLRSKTAEPLEKIATAVVFGLLAAILGAAAAVLGTIFVVRLLIILIDLLPGFPHHRAVYAAEFLLGGIFLLVGLFLWRKRRPVSKR